MPSPYSSRGHPRGRPRDRGEPGHAVARAADRARRCAAYDGDPRAEPFNGAEPDITEENLQARIRGNLVMALSNKFGWLVLTTGNKSEMSVGYATLYGDMAGGFAVLKDVFKGLVYRPGALAQRAGRPRAGAGVRCSSARRRPSCATSSATRTRCRRTTCSTPILAGYVEEDLDAAELVRRGLPARGRGARDRAGGPRRVQAPPGAARASRSRPRRSAATGGCRSRTASEVGSGAGGSGGGCVTRHGRDRATGAQPALVVGEVRRPRPRSSGLGGARGLARAPCPRVTGRRKVVLFDWPIATHARPDTAK